MFRPYLLKGSQHWALYFCESFSKNTPIGKSPRAHLEEVRKIFIRSGIKRHENLEYILLFLYNKSLSSVIGSFVLYNLIFSSYHLIKFWKLKKYF